MSTPLNPERLRADPLADAVMTRLLGADPGGPDLLTIGQVNGQLERWQTNGALAGWKADPGTPPAVAEALENYLAAALALPDWADAKRIARAEKLFMDYSLLSCTLLYCASLPECYVVPDMADVLQITGQLEKHTEYRIRATAAMIFPVMMRGGLTSPDGAGVAQVLKVRLIHATIRHLILRGDPAAAGPRAVVPALKSVAPPTNMYQALYAHGWNAARDGLPCNQEELAYTLLTFSYVFLRSMRKLGLGLPKADEEAYLHAWNVVGHVLGIERALMADTMDQAEVQFARIQARSRRQAIESDPRPALGRALMQTMEDVIPMRLIKPFPVLLTRYLCGGQTIAAIGLERRVSLLSRALFALFMLVIRTIDFFGSLFYPGFSIARFLTRIAGYQFVVKVLMDQTRPLKLPPGLIGPVSDMMQTWHSDTKAPDWVNALEKRFTGAPSAAAEGRRA